MSPKIQTVGQPSELDAILGANDLVVVKFTAEWCELGKMSNQTAGPCKMISPLIEKLNEQYTNIKFAEVDVDRSQQIAQKYSVSSMPTFVYFHNKAEVDRTIGANPQAVSASLSKLSKKSSNATVSDDSSSASGPSASGNERALLKEIQEYIPKGYELLNDSVHFGEAEALNIIPTAVDNQVRPLFNVTRLPGSKETGIMSDADSQILIYIPLANKSKVYSILLRTGTDAKKPDGDDVQAPSSIKVWANTTGTISFDDAASGSGALHDSEVSAPDANGWSEIKLRYVRFQSVSSLLIFLDGEDEDECTALQRIVLIGNKGDSREQGKLEKIE